jgi:FkbM family methyltransferase
MSPTDPVREISGEEFIQRTEQFEILWLYSHLRDVLKRLDVDCVWDVGANTGQFGRMLRSYAKYDGWIVSFEPVSRAFSELTELAQRDGRWRVFKVALGSRDEERVIKVADNTVLSSFLESSDYSVEAFGRKHTAVTAEENVSVRTIDSIATDVMEDLPDARVFLKLDTQGWDLEVMEGAQNFLQRVVGLQSEVSLKALYDGMPHYVETLSYLERKGFELSGLFPVNRDRKLRLIELDCVVVRPAEVSDPVPT